MDPSAAPGMPYSQVTFQALSVLLVVVALKKTTVICAPDLKLVSAQEPCADCVAAITGRTKLSFRVFSKGPPARGCFWSWLC